MITEKKEKKSVNWSDIQEKGFLIIPSFLSEEDLAVFKQEFEAVQKSNDNHNYNIPAIGEKVMNFFRQKKEVLDTLTNAQKNGIKADIIMSGNYFPARKGQKFHWHQDSDSYYTCQNHYDYLNFYIPIIKPRKEKSNLNIIPFDLMKELDSVWYEKVVKGGAIDYFPKKKTTKVYDDDLKGKTIHVLDFNINDVAVTPHLNAGDLLLMRGDIVHSTQDVDTSRVAISIRAVNGNHELDYDWLIKGTFSKINGLIGYAWMHKYIISVFRKLKKQKIPIRALLTENFGVTVKSDSKLRLALEILYLRFKLKFPALFKSKF